MESSKVVPVLKTIGLVLALLSRDMNRELLPIYEVAVAVGREYMKRMHALWLESCLEHLTVVTGQHLRDQVSRIVSTGIKGGGGGKVCDKEASETASQWKRPYPSTLP